MQPMIASYGKICQECVGHRRGSALNTTTTMMTMPLSLSLSLLLSLSLDAYSEVQSAQFQLGSVSVGDDIHRNYLSEKKLSHFSTFLSQLRRYGAPAAVAAEIEVRRSANTQMSVRFFGQYHSGDARSPTAAARQKSSVALSMPHSPNHQSRMAPRQRRLLQRAVYNEFPRVPHALK